MVNIVWHRKVLWSNSYKISIPTPILNALNLTEKNSVIIRKENSTLILEKSPKIKKRAYSIFPKKIKTKPETWEAPLVKQSLSLRITIPRPLAEKLNLDKNSYVEIWLEDNKIYIRKMENPPKHWLIKKRGLRKGYARK